MNIYKGLNEITKYIEEHLEEDIQYQNLAKIIGVDVYTMKRIFFLLCNISITEYIRKRRLSNAGCDLMKQKKKVMEKLDFSAFWPAMPKRILTGIRL